LAAAITESGLTHVVVLSSFGADQTDKTGPVVGLHNLEKKLDGIARLNALYLRAGYFLENLLPQVGVIQSLGMIAGPVRPDLPLPMIATRDIGAAAAEALLRLDFDGKRRRELQGARDLTYVELARIPTGFRAKTAILVPQLKRFYVAAPRHGKEAAGVKVYEVQ